MGESSNVGCCVSHLGKKGKFYIQERESMQLEMFRFKPSLIWLCPQFICSSFRGIAAQKNVSHKRQSQTKRTSQAKQSLDLVFKV